MPADFAPPRWHWFHLLLVGCLVGCATTRTSDTPRTGVEQLLISNAVDQALSKVDFSPLRGRSVLVQDKYFDGVDKNYVIGSIRHRVLETGARLVEKEEEADVVMEVRSGGVGTDSVSSFVGSPQFAVPLPLPLQVPEVRLIDTRTQIGSAKIALIAYDAKTRQALGAGGITMARSYDVNRFYFGAGPFNSGTVKEEVSAATGQAGFAQEIARQIPGLSSSAYAVSMNYGNPVSFGADPAASTAQLPQVPPGPPGNPQPTPGFAPHDATGPVLR